MIREKRELKSRLTSFSVELNYILNMRSNAT